MDDTIEGAKGKEEEQQEESRRAEERAKAHAKKNKWTLPNRNNWSLHGIGVAGLLCCPPSMLATPDQPPPLPVCLTRSYIQRHFHQRLLSSSVNPLPPIFIPPFLALTGNSPSPSRFASTELERGYSSDRSDEAFIRFARAFQPRTPRIRISISL